MRWSLTAAVYLFRSTDNVSRTCGVLREQSMPESVRQQCGDVKCVSGSRKITWKIFEYVSLFEWLFTFSWSYAILVVILLSNRMVTNIHDGFMRPPNVKLSTECNGYDKVFVMFWLISMTKYYTRIMIYKTYFR